MALIQISDPEIKTEIKRKFSVGIDLGTTHSLIAERVNDKITIFEDNGSYLIPSIVSEVEGNLIIGQKHHKNSISSIKRLIGLNSDEAKKIDFGELLIDSSLDMPTVTLREKKYNAIELSSKILSHLCSIAHNNKSVESAVITVPAYFNDMQRQATKLAAEMADIEVLRLISEPTAAAIAYGIQDSQKGNFIIYDLGGGTFDVSVLTIEKGIFKVLSTKGDTHLGGDDIDRLLVEYICTKYENLLNLSTMDLYKLARSLKHQLSQKNIATENSYNVSVSILSLIHI